MTPIKIRPTGISANYAGIRRTTSFHLPYYVRCSRSHFRRLLNQIFSVVHGYADHSTYANHIKWKSVEDRFLKLHRPSLLRASIRFLNNHSSNNWL